MPICLPGERDPPFNRCVLIRAQFLRRDRLPPGAFVHLEPSPARSARSSKHALNREECVGCGRRLPAHVPLALQRIVLESVR